MNGPCKASSGNAESSEARPSQVASRSKNGRICPGPRKGKRLRMAGEASVEPSWATGVCAARRHLKYPAKRGSSAGRG